MGEPVAKVSTTSVLLDGQVSEKVQQKVDAAKARQAAAADLTHLTPAQAGFIADVVTRAQRDGKLVFHRKRFRSCSICGRSGGYAKYKSGPRRGMDNWDRPLKFAGIDLGWQFVQMEGYAVCGGCEECVTPLLSDIAEALRGVSAEVPPQVRADGEPVRTKYGNRHCKKCDWSGHEGEMRWERTLMGDGKYPAYCPSCGAGGAFSRDVETVDGFAVVEQDNGSPKEHA
jgi:hypothetical protein